ncbi:MAG: hypothetical protein JWM73_1300 [Solirubrobacterales bacterium]|nr:hypothetical protein [Solirubrobacterales bacterium]
MPGLNALRWNGSPGHYEVHYLTTTDPETGTGLWIRQTMLAPLAGEPTCSVWFMATFPDAPAVARKVTLPIAEQSAQTEPFRLRTGPAELTDTGMRGELDGARWDLRWEPGAGYEHVSPLLQRARIAKTILVLPHGDVRVGGTVTLPDGRELALDGAHGGQAHLWGSKHSARWTWAHCGDFADADGTPQPGAFVDGVSVFVPRFGREVGPSSPVVGRFLGEDFLATSPRAVLRAPSSFGLTSWSLEATAGKRRIACEVDAPRGSLVGVTYTDPDGEQAYCYNSEVASMRVSVFDRADGRWDLRQTLTSRGRAHFEYGQREPVPGLELHLS